MPLSRKKSCVRCRNSKLRCNQATPACSRCSERGIRCVYDWKHENTGPVLCSPVSRASRISPISAGMLEASPQNAPQSGDTSEISSAPASMFMSSSYQPGSAVLDAFELDWIAAERSLNTPKPGPSLDVGTMSDSWTGAQGLPEVDLPAPFTEIVGITSPDKNASFHLVEEIPRAPDSDYTLHGLLPDSNQLRSPRVLFQRRRVLRHSALGVVVLGQLASYPKMMIQGDRLPPFIFAPCHLHEELSFDCARSRRHRCLSKELAVCAGLVEMFYSRTPQNAPFVWQTIYGEQDRLRKEHANFSPQQQIAALQAITIYILLQAQDVESSERNGAHALMATVVVLRLIVMQEMCITISRRNKLASQIRHETPDREHWAHEESVTRTMVLLIIIDLMMDCLLELERRVYSTCSYNFQTIPLPATRDLWEAQSSFAWRTEYERYLSQRQTKNTLTIGDLLALDEAGVLSTLSRPDQKWDIVPDILTWCDGLDSLGSLLWMVMPFQHLRTQAEVSQRE